MRNKFRFIALLLMVGLAFVLVACGDDGEDIVPVTQYNVLGNFEDGGDNVYDITTNTASSLSFTYAKSTFAYGYMTSGEITQDLSIFKKLVITYEGSGSILVKLETSDGTPGKEVNLNVTAIQGSVEWNLINDSAFLAKVDKVIIIASPGKLDSAGNVTISKLEFSVDVAANFIINTDYNNIPQNENEYDGTGTMFDFNAKWEDNGDNVYDVETVGETTVVEFDKQGFEWAAMVSRVKGEFANFNYVVAIVSGTEGQRLLLKAANLYEASVLLTAEEQEIVIDISEMTDVEKNGINQILFFGLAGTGVGVGTFTIHEAFMIEEYDYVAPYIVNEYNGTDEMFEFTNWYDGGAGDYGVEVIGTDTVLTYDKSGPWNFAISYVEGNFTGFNVVEFELTGMVGKTALLKVEAPTGAVEMAVTFDGTRQTFVVDISDLSNTVLETINKVLIFAAQDVAIGTGTITVHSATFKQAMMTYEGYNFLDGWTESVAGVYTQDLTENGLVVDYVKGPTNDWGSHMRRDFDVADAEGYNTLVMVLDGEAGKQVLVKPNDLGSLEQWVTFGDNPVTIMVSASSFTTVILFAEGGTTNVSGQFTIILATLTYVAPTVDVTKTVDANIGWMENDADTYDITYVDGTAVVDYTKGGNGWAFMKTEFVAEEVQGLNTLTMVVSGTSGKQILVKPNDNGAIEQWITFGDDPITVVINADSFANIILFAEPDTASVTGQFTIHSAVLSYTYSATVWTDGDDGAFYTITLDNGTVTVDYTKGVGITYVFIRTVFPADLVSGLNTLTITLSGTEGKTVLVKPNDNGAIETMVTFGTEPITLVVTADSFVNIIIFAEGGTDNVSGTFTILDVTLSYVAPTE